MTAYVARLRRSLRGCRPKLSFGLCLFEEGYSLDLFGLFIPLAFLDRLAREPNEMMERWGFTYFMRAIQCSWGCKCKCISMPWDLDHIKHEVRRPDGSWVPYVGSWEVAQPIKNTDGMVVIGGGKEPDGREAFTFDYTYILKSGEVQHRIATIYVERREWRQKWLKWCPLFAKKRKSIDVSFNDEVGERTGSWKGGVMGTGYEMRKGETPEATLRRMECEHKM